MPCHAFHAGAAEQLGAALAWPARCRNSKLRLAATAKQRGRRLNPAAAGSNSRLSTHRPPAGAEAAALAATAAAVPQQRHERHIAGIGQPAGQHDCKVASPAKDCRQDGRAGMATGWQALVSNFERFGGRLPTGHALPQCAAQSHSDPITKPSQHACPPTRNSLQQQRNDDKQRALQGQPHCGRDRQCAYVLRSTTCPGLQHTWRM